MKEYQYRILDKDNQQRGDYIYRLLGRKPAEIGLTTTDYWIEGHKIRWGKDEQLLVTEQLNNRTTWNCKG
jgi:hypothetical protein